MAAVMITCPVTDEPVDTGIGMSFETFRHAEMTNNTFECAACGAMHTWQKDEAFPDA